MLKRKQISETSWMIYDGIRPFGFLRKIGAGYMLMVGEEKFDFTSHDDFEKMFGKIKDIEHQNNDDVEINGFPARHPGANVVEHDDLPLYNTGGNVVFVAGFFALKFDNSKSWQVVHGPKHKTLEANSFVGPFKTRLEALREVNIENRKLENVEEKV